RLHPGIAALRQAWYQGELGTLRGLRLEWPAATAGTDLAREAVPRAVDVVRALLGEIEALPATGDPPGEHPDVELLVQLRAIDSRRAELRTWPGPGEPARLTLLGAEGSLTLEFDRSFDQPARLIGRTSSLSEPIT